MKIELVDLKRQYFNIKEEIDEAISRVIQNSSFILGEETEKFEQEFAKMNGFKYTLGVGSGTAALFLAFLALGIKKDDKIITTPNTFIASTEAFTFFGAEPIFADIKEDGNMNEDIVEELIDEKTVGILAVHIYGNMLDIKKLRGIANKYGIFLVEDCAQAHFAEFDGIRAGSTGDISIFSFYPGKNLGAYGDAGAIVTGNNDLYKKMKMLRNHGRTAKYEHHIEGLCERMDGIQAAVLNVKLRYIEEWTRKRIEIAEKYNNGLNGLNLNLPEIIDKRSVFHLYVVRLMKNRDEVLKYLNENGIMAGIHYPVPLHLQPVYYERRYGGKHVKLPASEKFAKKILSIPLFPEITDEEIGHVVSKMKEAIEKYSDE